MPGIKGRSENFPSGLKQQRDLDIMRVSVLAVGAKTDDFNNIVKET